MALSSNPAIPQLSRAALVACLPPWASTEAGGAAQPVQPLQFAKWKIDPKEVFFVTPLSFAFVNLKPIVPGHVLVSPKRVVERFTDLTVEEVSDIWKVAQQIGYVTKALHGADSLTFAIQDGLAAGQTVPHAHIHVMPRRPGDFKRQDQVYEELEATDFSRKPTEKEAHSGNETKKDPQPSTVALDDEQRKPRTLEEMSAEAANIMDYIKNKLPE